MKASLPEALGSKFRAELPTAQQGCTFAKPESVALEIPRSVLWAILTAGSFELACRVPQLAWATVIYLFGLLQLARSETSRGAFYSGFAVGMLIGGTELHFFWQIFGGGAVALWCVYAFWIGAFVVLARQSFLRLPWYGSLALVPLIWCGLEYFRSELYYLRFSWLSPGFAFGQAPTSIPIHPLGVYGIGCALMVLALISNQVWSRSKTAGVACLALGVTGLMGAGQLTGKEPQSAPRSSVRVAGIQMEFPTEAEVIGRLNQLIRAVPEAQLLVLSEYTLADQVSEKLRNWCRTHGRYLVVGGKEPAGKDNFYDMAYVVSPTGEICFQQGKSVPIQFFKDGLPAPAQQLWDSPWGRIGICICYDLSYTRVTDELVRQQAQALIIPTMDVVDWGLRQHELHALVAPVRAAEYGLPLFRVASSGISQLVDANGRVQATAPCPGDGAILAGTLEFREPGSLPLDRWLAPVSTTITAGFLLWCSAGWFARRSGRSRKEVISAA